MFDPFDSSFALTLLGWWLAGFLGGLHCLGMCGGLAAALGLNAVAGRRVALLLAANLGRLASYVAIGTVLGGLAGAVAWLPAAARLQTLLFLLSQLLVILLGLYLAGWSPLLARLERIGGTLWRRLQPRFAALLPLRSLPAAFAAGGLWGWLPCGLVYTAATGALAGGSAARGALVMLAFGLGTLPNLLAMGAAAGQLRRLRDRRGIRLAAGGLLVALALAELLRWAAHQVA
ncbi:sulfite exporter TauE/SafE family protein [Chitinimonas koreensis]|uniref:sulfite exporter TauE/SafE family protein n=1 Tax=Chitinimonas koreensis TaxID=356302 RepID=UPI00040D06C4|nr:sulfite exporter TauE/SafE family protein [Chitinimonas koreensis]QNM94728.1 sulfite exporter TauE/SafE family protein [Chitinimonas koreensis]